MELKMAEVLAKINEMQSGTSKTRTTTETDQERVRQLEKQLAEMTDKRIDYVERLQEQQLAMQVCTGETNRSKSYILISRLHALALLSVLYLTLDFWD